ncbi:hypothetical protein AMECASPLE_034382 [Ameca splendens]|uniref:Uncharacterized protein n=1 Tax=Ameca splendens TaxID=208324 RepID=A0ABV1AEM2_9TELE
MNISPLACKCSGDDQQEGAGRTVEAVVRSDGLSPQKDKSYLNFAVIGWHYSTEGSSTALQTPPQWISSLLLQAQP